MTSRPLIAAAAALLLTTFETAVRSPLQAQGAKPVFGTFGIDTAQMDTSVKPGDDFYRYVNGKWLSTFQIPADKSAYGACDLLGDTAEEDIRVLRGELSQKRPPAGSVGQKVVDLYESWMDLPTLETRGIALVPNGADANGVRGEIAALRAQRGGR